LITLGRARTAGRVGSHGDLEWRRGEELVGEVDAVLKGGDGGAGELHGITAKLPEVTVWLEKGRRVGVARAGSGTGRAAAMVSDGGLRRQRGSSGGRQSSVTCLGKARGKEAKRWASSRATRGAALEQEVTSDDTTRRPAAALLRGIGEAKEEEGGGGVGG
jgi:hypothetical protein